MWESLLDLVFPRTSLTGRRGEFITQEERRLLASHPVVEEAAALRARGLQSLDRVVAGSTYRGCPLLRKAIHTFKYRRIPWLQEDLARLIVQAAASPVPEPSPVLCPVPLHWTRQFERGFNQSILLAERVGKELGLSVAPLLRRVRPTGHQAWRGRGERFDAVRNAFRCTASHAPRHIVLIDDLSTTGATLEMCAKVLKSAGAEFVEGWVVAHDES